MGCTKIIFIYVIVFVSIVQMLKGAHYKLKHSVVNTSLKFCYFNESSFIMTVHAIITK